MKKLILVMLACLFLVTNPLFASFQDAFKAQKEGNYKAAFNEFLFLAKKNHVNAQVNLGNLYAAGAGIPRDFLKAKYWWEKAYSQRSALAALNLGKMYYNGFGVPVDQEKGLQLILQAANSGISTAQFWIAQFYLSDLIKIHSVLTPDHSKAYMWLSLAAAQNNTIAAKELLYLKNDMASQQIEEGNRLLSKYSGKRRADDAGELITLVTEK